MKWPLLDVQAGSLQSRQALKDARSPSPAHIVVSVSLSGTPFLGAKNRCSLSLSLFLFLLMMKTCICQFFKKNVFLEISFEYGLCDKLFLPRDGTTAIVTRKFPESSFPTLLCVLG